MDIWAANIRERDDIFINLENQWTSEGSPDFLSATQDVVTAIIIMMDGLIRLILV